MIFCGDCHNSDQGKGAGGSGPSGPHGSLYAPILERQLTLSDGSQESSGAYALCYKCHNRSSILADESFPLHRLHVVDEQTSCLTCHDPHGSAQNTHLINFSSRSVQADSRGRLEFIDEGPQRGSCALSCHGVEHSPATYPDGDTFLNP